MKKILILHTGGTIAMKENDKTGVVTQTKNHPLSKHIGNYQFHVAVDERIIMDLPSPQMSVCEMMKIKDEIEQALDDYDGFVVTHGTDTLEETAYFLDLVIQTEKPIIVTGAMRSSNELGSDALSNVLSSIRVAAEDESIGKGVLVVMNEEIHAAKHVVKTSATDLASFKSPSYGPIGYVSKQGIHLEQMILNRKHYPVAKLDAHVVLLKSYAGMDGSLIRAIHHMKPDGLVIEAFGQGNLPKAVVEPVEQILNEQIPVVIVSRCYKGNVLPTYGYEGGGRHLESMGVILTSGLTGPKARLKLLVCLEQTNDFNKLNELMNN